MATMIGKIEAVLDAGPLRLMFARDGDRIGHLILHVGHSAERPILWSVEGDPAEDWPASPPFQSLHVERPPETPPRALLVGMAGQSHWSASIEADPVSGRLHFDMACRVRTPNVARLGVEYHSAWQLFLHDDSARLTSGAAPDCELVIELSRAFGASCLEATDRGLVIAPRSLESSHSSHTVRWAYTIAAEGDHVR